MRTASSVAQDSLAPTSMCGIDCLVMTVFTKKLVRNIDYSSTILPHGQLKATPSVAFFLPSFFNAWAASS